MHSYGSLAREVSNFRKSSFWELNKGPVKEDGKEEQRQKEQEMWSNGAEQIKSWTMEFNVSLFQVILGAYVYKFNNNNMLKLE